MSIKELRTLVDQWKPRLGLENWKISVRWAKKGEVEEYCHGLVFWTTELATARILISKKSDDYLHTVVHELLHIRLEGHLSEVHADDPLYEQALNKLAEALISGWEVETE